jgi:hypothetical protein
MLTKIKYIFQDFISFLKHPIVENGKKVGFFYYLIVFALVMIIASILGVGILFIFSIIDIPIVHYNPAEIPQPIPYEWNFLLAVLITPLVEELIFRYPLKYWKNSLFIAFTVLFVSSTFTNSYAVISRILNLTSEFDFNRLIYRSLWFIVFALLIFVATRFDKINKILSKFWDRYLIVIVYVLAAWFAYLHFPLPKTEINWVWLPARVAPQFFMALYFSYIRLRVNFSYCIFLHMILNGAALSPDLFNI